MEWNNGKERALFEREQAKLRKEYFAAGMTGEQIQKVRAYDEEWYRRCRREAKHTQRLNITAFDEDEGDNEAKNPLMKKFLHKFSVEDKHFENDRFGWIEEIKERKLYESIKLLDDKEKEILTSLIYDDETQTELAQRMMVSQQSISKKIKKFKNIFGKWL